VNVNGLATAGRPGDPLRRAIEEKIRRIELRGGRNCISVEYLHMTL